MFERNSLRVSFKGKQFFYQAEELSSQGVEKTCRYAILFPDLQAAKKFDKVTRHCHMTIKNFFGSYHAVIRNRFKIHKSILSAKDSSQMYSGLLTVQEVGRKS